LEIHGSKGTNRPGADREVRAGHAPERLVLARHAEVEVEVADVE
jgi:hypothetical protein